jgi:hypothetical protein
LSEVNTAPAPVSPTRPSGLRYRAGRVFFILSFVLPLCGVCVPLMGLDKATTAPLIGGLLVGGPELAIVIAVALWGKETFTYFMGRAKGLLRTLAPPEHVSPARYRFGLFLIVGSCIPSWLFVYAPHCGSATGAASPSWQRPTSSSSPASSCWEGNSGPKCGPCSLRHDVVQ